MMLDCSSSGNDPKRKRDYPWMLEVEDSQGMVSVLVCKQSCWPTKLAIARLAHHLRYRI